MEWINGVRCSDVEGIKRLVSWYLGVKSEGSGAGLNAAAVAAAGVGG